MFLDLKIYKAMIIINLTVIFNLAHQPLSAPYTEVADNCPLEVVKESVGKKNTLNSHRIEIIVKLLTRFISVETQCFISTGDSDSEGRQSLCGCGVGCTGVERHWALEDEIRVTGNGLLQRITGSVGSRCGHLEAGWINGEDLATGSDRTGHRPQQLRADAGIHCSCCQRRKETSSKEYKKTSHHFFFVSLV